MVLRTGVSAFLSPRRILVRVHRDLFKIERRIVYDYWPEPLSSLEVMVLILEDRRFFQHHGVDFISCVRELSRALLLKSHGGASTIDMQLVRTATGYRERTLRRKLYEIFSNGRAFFAGKDIVVQEAAVDLINDCVAHFRRAVAAIGDQHAATPIEPFVAIFVVNKNVFCSVPNERRLTAHGLGFQLTQLFERGYRIRMRELRNNPAILGFDSRNYARRNAEFFAHVLFFRSRENLLGVNGRPIARLWNLPFVGFCAGEPSFLGGDNLAKGLVGRLTVRGAVFQIGNIGYPTGVFFAPKQINMILTHLSHSMLSRFLLLVQAIGEFDRAWPGRFGRVANSTSIRADARKYGDCH